MTDNVDLYENRYAYWLDGKAGKWSQADYFIRDVMDQFESCKLETHPEQNEVRLEIAWQPYWTTEPIGSRQLDLDPTKGFLPVRGYARFELKRKNADPMWRHEEFSVVESMLVGDVWMPSKLREVIRASSAGPDQAVVWETKVARIEAGTVTPADLEVSFPEGTEVQDAIKGVFYVVGPDKKHSKLHPLIGFNSPGSQPPARPRPWGVPWIIIVANLVLVAIVVGILLLRGRQRGVAQTTSELSGCRRHKRKKIDLDRPSRSSRARPQVADATGVAATPLYEWASTSASTRRHSAGWPRQLVVWVPQAEEEEDRPSDRPSTPSRPALRPQPSRTVPEIVCSWNETPQPPGYDIGDLPRSISGRLTFSASWAYPCWFSRKMRCTTRRPC